MRVFFYGLFMDADRLAGKGLLPAETAVGYVDGYALRIGERATLLPSADARAYGVMMDMGSDQVEALYSEPSVSDYVAETVTVTLADGEQADAACYNLPGNKVAGANRDYAEALLALATRLGFPEIYLEQIRRAGSSGR